ncbi:Pentapeptide repeats (8 copies) [compost metagenome]
MIACDLRNADLRHADLIGADLRDADLGGADLTGSIFLTQSQLNAAKGNSRTRLPAHLNLPEHWL